MITYLPTQLRIAQTKQMLPHCVDHDRPLMDWSGEQLEPPCGCKLLDDGTILLAQLTFDVSDVSRPRVSTKELTDKLGENLGWINLRTKLMTLLRQQADEGDVNARSQLDYVTRVWPGGGAPRHTEFTILEQKITNLKDLLRRIRDEAGREMTMSLLEEIQLYLEEE